MAWLTDSFMRVWLPISNYYYTVVYAEAGTGRISPFIENAVAVDPDAATVATFAPSAVTLRALWSGRELARWQPLDLDLSEVWEGCAPTFTLTGQALRMHYDCGEGGREQEVDW